MASRRRKVGNMVRAGQAEAARRLKASAEYLQRPGHQIPGALELKTLVSHPK